MWLALKWFFVLLKWNTLLPGVNAPIKIECNANYIEFLGKYLVISSISYKGIILGNCWVVFVTNLLKYFPVLYLRFVCAHKFVVLCNCNPEMNCTGIKFFSLAEWSIGDGSAVASQYISIYTGMNCFNCVLLVYALLCVCVCLGVGLCVCVCMSCGGYFSYIQNYWWVAYIVST